MVRYECFVGIIPVFSIFSNFFKKPSHLGLCGLMDMASDFGSEDCRFESCHNRKNYFSSLLEQLKRIILISQRSYQRNGRKKGIKTIKPIKQDRKNKANDFISKLIKCQPLACLHNFFVEQ